MMIQKLAQRAMETTRPKASRCLIEEIGNGERQLAGSLKWAPRTDAIALKMNVKVMEARRHVCARARRCNLGLQIMMFVSMFIFIKSKNYGKIRAQEVLL